LKKKGITLTYVFEKVVEKNEVVDLRDYIVSRPYPGPNDPPLDVLISDMNLANKIDSIWHGSYARRETVLRDLFEHLGVRKTYSYIIVDTIPFYDRKYAILIFYAADLCVVPLRPTIIDVYRTISMLRELPRITRRKESEVYSKIGLVFNMVDSKSTTQKKLINTARELFKTRMSADLYVFKATIPRLIAFSRIGTEEERREDRKTVEERFREFFNEFKKWVNSKIQ